MKHHHTRSVSASPKLFWASCMSIMFAMLLAFTCFLDSAHAEELASVEDGVYIISSEVGEGKVLDIAGGSTANGGNVQIFQNNRTFAQYWRIERVGEHYRISNSITGIVLDVDNAGKQNRTNAQVFQWNGSDAQLWDFVKQGNGSYAIRSVCNGLMLDVDNASNVDGTNVQLFEGNGSAAQCWGISRVERVEGFDDGLYTVSSSIDSGLVLDVSGASRQNGAAVQIWSSNGSLAQKWQIAYNESTGFYSIVSVASGKALDVPSGNSQDAVKLQQFDQNSSAAQSWRIVPEGESGYAIHSALGRAIDIPNAEARSGVQAQLWGANSTAAQIWSFETTDFDLSGLYQVESSRSSNALLDVSNASKDEDAKIQVWERNGSLAQKWQFSKLEDGSYAIRNVATGLYLSDDGSGAFKSIASYDGSAAHWTASVGKGGFTFSNVNTGKVLDLYNAETASGTLVWPFVSNNTDAQAWALVSTPLVDEGCYILLNGSGRRQALDVPGASVDNGVGLQTYDSNGTSAQKWLVESAGNGWYTIINAASGLALDVKDGSAQAGNTVQQFEKNGTNAQLWKFEIAVSGGIQIVSKLGDLALTIDDDVAVSGSKAIVDVPGSNTTFSWNYEATTYTNVQEVSDIWGDTSYISQMRSLAEQKGGNSNWIAIADKSRDRCTVFHRSGGKWVLANSMDVITSGNTFTGTHDVYIRARGYWKEPNCIDVNDWYVGYAQDWWPSPSSDNMRYVEGKGYDEGQGFHYGFAGSGCICIPDYSKAKWLYDNMEVGSTVYIF